MHMPLAVFSSSTLIFSRLLFKGPEQHTEANVANRPPSMPPNTLLFILSASLCLRGLTRSTTYSCQHRKLAQGYCFRRM